VLQRRTESSRLLKKASTTATCQAILIFHYGGMYEINQNYSTVFYPIQYYIVLHQLLPPKTNTGYIVWILPACKWVFMPFVVDSQIKNKPAATIPLPYSLLRRH